MSEKRITRRKYDSSRRLAQAAETRDRILLAAYRLFSKHGYSGTTMQAIADEAAIAFQTVYANFKNKRKMLVELFNVSSAPAGEEHTPMPERALPRAAGLERDQRRQLQMFSQVVADNLAGVAPISEIMVDAARTERDIRKLLERLNSQRLEHMGLFVNQLTTNDLLRGDKDFATARDIVWALASPEVFLMLTRDRGWPKEQYRLWLEEALACALLP